ncbi:MAG: efflux RND transporter periplasmic adaptor subunit [Phycisphaerae bacterium]|nr:efflux RND transporter periplasmic adaptor subunit [Phycisphaerae bacterium]
MPNKSKANNRFSARLLMTAAVVALLCGVCLVDICFSADTNSSARIKLIEAVTHPSYDGMLSFPVAGRVLEVPVKIGQRVKKGQLLVKLDDRVELARLEQLQNESQNEVRVKAAEAQRAQKKLELKRVKQLFAKRAASKTELEQAELEYKTAGYSVDLAKFELAQAGLQYAEMKHQIERMKIVAPCDGFIEKLEVETGESVERAQDVVRLVKIDPLWVDIPVPLKIANALQSGGSIKIYFDEALKDPGEGKIIHVAVVADAALDARVVRIEIPNPKSRPAGMRVWAKFSKIVAAK